MAVVLVMLDGTRPDALAQTDCPTLHRLMARGAYTLQAASVMPSITLPCHTSIFHSVPPQRHGIVSNTWTPLARPLPGLLEQARAAGKRAGFFFNWEQLRDMSRPGSLAMSYFCDGAESDPASDDHIAEVAARNLQAGTLDFAFVYLGTIDTAGHAYGWMSPQYLAQLTRVDAALGRLLAALPADTSVIVQSDHGGHERTHGTAMPADMLIPWLAVGPTIRQNYQIAEPVSLLDTAPTIARLLGVPAAPQWEGRCVEEIFVGAS